MHYLAIVLTAAALLLSGLASAPAVPSAAGAVLAQATATPTATPTPRAATGWTRTDHPDDVRCYTAWLDGQPYGGCVVVP